MARIPATGRSPTGRTTDAAARPTPYHAPKPRNLKATKQGFLLPGPDTPPVPAHVVGLPTAGVHPAPQAAPPAPPPALVAWVNAHFGTGTARANALRELAANPAHAAALMHPAAAAPAPAPLPLPTPAPTPAPAAQAPAPASPYANLDPEVASLLQGLDTQTQQQAAAIQAVNAAALPAAQQFAQQLQQGMGGLVQLAGTPLGTGATPSDVPANVAALPGVLSQQGQQQALAQAAQSVAGAYNLPAQVQAQGMGDLAQFYGGANQNLEGMLSDIATQQMTTQSQQAVEAQRAASAQQVAQTNAGARAQAANTSALARILAQQIASGHYADANKTALQLQRLRNQGSATTAGIRAAATTQAAATRAAQPKGGVFIPGGAKPKAPGYTWRKVAGGWQGIKLPTSGKGAAAKPLSPSSMTSLRKSFQTLWQGQPPSASNITPPPGWSKTADPNQRGEQVAGWMQTYAANFPGKAGLARLLKMISSVDPQAAAVANRWIGTQQSGWWPGT